MNLPTILTILAIVLAPLITILISRYLDKIKEKREAKLWIFRTLMATRATALSHDHVRALNMIDVTFYGKNKKSKYVVEAWKVYLDNLAKNTKDMSEDLLKQWNEKNQELLIELLQKMANCLGYDFDKSSIRNTSYFPKGIGDQEIEQMIIRKGFVELLNGEASFPVELIVSEPNEEGKKFVASLKNYFAGKTTLKIKVER